jgi:nicotinamide-nucleotide amidase
MPSDAERVIAAAKAAGLTVAVAESLTGGDVCVKLVAVPGSSEVLRGGVVAYAIDVKVSALGVEPSLLDRHGPVSAQTAAAMARGVRAALGADVGIATTGAAGPEPHGGKPPGTAFIAVDSGDSAPRIEELDIEGDRTAVCAGVRDAALALAADEIEHHAKTGELKREQA